MNPNTPKVSLRDAESSDNINMCYFICRVPKEVATNYLDSKFQLKLRHGSQNSKVTI